MGSTFVVRVHCEDNAAALAAGEDDAAAPAAASIRSHQYLRLTLSAQDHRRRRADRATMALQKKVKRKHQVASILAPDFVAATSPAPKGPANDHGPSQGRPAQALPPGYIFRSLKRKYKCTSILAPEFVGATLPAPKCHANDHGPSQGR